MYKQLIKLFFKENFSFKRLLGFDLKRSKTKAILVGLALIYAIVVFLGSFGYLFFDLGRILNGMGQPEILLSFITIYSIGLSIMIVLFRASGYLFYYKDYDILAPLPIHPRTVLFAKMTVMMVMLYISAFILTLPIVFSYFYWTGFNILSIIFFLVAFLFVPLAPIIVMSFLSLLVAMVTSKFRRSKLISIILIFVIMIGIFMFSFSINETSVNPLTGQINLFSGIGNAYPPFKWFITAINEHSFLNLGLLISTHSIAFVIFMFSIQGLVQRTNQKGIKSNIRKNNKQLKYQEKSVLVTLVQKEFKKFLSSTIYAINAGFGPVILIFLSIASLFYQSQIESYLGEMIGTGLDVEVLILVLIGFTVAMTYTPAISLSLEGKNFWILKSLPIKAETIVYSKIAFNLLLIVPIAAISILLFGISIGFSIVTQLILIVLIVVFAVLISAFDAIMNMLLPKFDFVNEAEVVKQSVTALLGIFGGFTFIALSGLVYSWLSDMMSFNSIALILIGINLVLTVPMIYFIINKSAIIFSKMKA